MISPSDYWKDREKLYPDEWTAEIQENGAETINKVNRFLELAKVEGIVRNTVSSGWRPKALNDLTSNAAKKSNHILAKACDIADPDRALAQWMILNKSKLSECGLWAEDPRWCAKKQKDGTIAYWVHLQTVPPASGKLIFIPSVSPPSAPKLVGQGDLPEVRIV